MAHELPSPHEDRWVLFLVRTGRASVRFAANWLGWTVYDVQMAVWGRIVQ
jgi:hypothetical protein